MRVSPSIIPPRGANSGCGGSSANRGIAAAGGRPPTRSRIARRKVSVARRQARRLNEGELEFLAPTIQIAHVLHEKVNLLKGLIGIVVEDKLAAVGQSESGHVRVLADQFQAQNIAIELRRAGDAGHTQNDAINLAEHTKI